MLFTSGGPPRTMETARRMSETLSKYETKARPIDHDRIYSDMEKEVSRMKADLGDMGKLITGLAPFSDKELAKPQQIKVVADPSKPLVNLDVSAYRPDELTVRGIGNNVLEVIAEHHEKNGMSESHRKLKRHFEIPPEVDINTILPTLTADGRLLIEAPQMNHFAAF